METDGTEGTDSAGGTDSAETTDATPETAVRSTAPTRSPGVRIRYALLGAVAGALLGLVVGLVVELSLAKLGTIDTATGTAITTIAAVAAVIGAARGSATSTRFSGDRLRITNPLKRYSVTPGQVARVVSVPSGNPRRGATVGLVLRNTYAQVPIRALRLPPLGSGRPAPALADLVRWVHEHDIEVRASAPAWNDVLRAGADDGASPASGW